MQLLPAAQAVALLPHRDYDEPQTILSTGKRGKGKTWAMKRYLQSREPRAFIVQKERGDFVPVGSSLESPTFEHAIRDLMANPEAPCWRVVTQPQWGSARESLSQWGERLFEGMVESLRNCQVTIDEYHRLLGENTSRPSAAQVEVITQARRYGLRQSLGTQRIVLLPTLLQAEVTEMLIFGVSLKADLDRIGDWAGEEAEEGAPYLERGECYLVEP